MIAGRNENGRQLMEWDLYAQAKHLRAYGDLDGWLYGTLDHGVRASMPVCLGEVIGGALALDIACLMLLIPQPELDFHWSVYWKGQPDSGLGPQAWIARLKKIYQLFHMHRADWRDTTHDLAHRFWTQQVGVSSLAPFQTSVVPSLF